MKILDGTIVAEQVYQKISHKVHQLQSQYKIQPGLAVVLIGNNPASEVYVNMKEKRATKYGFLSKKYVLAEDTSQEEVHTLLEQLNQDPSIHGILVQYPPPPHLNERLIIESINPKKDVDCFHPLNVGKFVVGYPEALLPCTPWGILEILNYYGIATEGRHVVVIGRSNIVGKPIAILLAQKGKDATVTICHSKTPHIESYTRQADILIVAIGKPHFIKANMVKENSVVIDVGINRVEDPSNKNGYRLIGDVDYEAVKTKVEAITPVPGGVGPMTIAMLLDNTIRACCQQHGITYTAL